jgi:ferredoxin
MVRVHLDRDACEGVFACLVRDDRFVEAEDGLADIEGEAVTRTPESVTVALDGDVESARAAAAACPFDAIEVEE